MASDKRVSWYEFAAAYNAVQMVKNDEEYESYRTQEKIHKVIEIITGFLGINYPNASCLGLALTILGKPSPPQADQLPFTLNGLSEAQQNFYKAIAETTLGESLDANIKMETASMFVIQDGKGTVIGLTDGDQNYLFEWEIGPSAQKEVDTGYDQYLQGIVNQIMNMGKHSRTSLSSDEKGYFPVELPTSVSPGAAQGETPPVDQAPGNELPPDEGGDFPVELPSSVSPDSAQGETHPVDQALGNELTQGCDSGGVYFGYDDFPPPEEHDYLPPDDQQQQS